MKTILSNASLAHEREARRKALDKRREFHLEESEPNEDGEWNLPKNKFIRLDRRYKRRIQKVTERHRRKAKQIAKLTGFFSKDVQDESN